MAEKHDYPVVQCPKCSRKLEAEGELTFLGNSSPLYSCPECLMEVELFGEKTELPLTFCVNGKGEVFYPSEPDFGESSKD